MSKVIITSAFNLDNETQDYLVSLSPQTENSIASAVSYMRSSEANAVELPCHGYLFNLDDCTVLSEEQLDTIRGYDPIVVESLADYPSTLLEYSMMIRVIRKEVGYKVLIGIGEDADSMAWCTLEEG